MKRIMRLNEVTSRQVGLAVGGVVDRVGLVVVLGRVVRLDDRVVVGRVIELFLVGLVVELELVGRVVA